MMKLLFILCCLLPAVSVTGQGIYKVGVGTITPIANLDVIGDTLGLRSNIHPGNSLFIDITGNYVNVNASGAVNGLSFHVGANTSGVYGNGQTLTRVMTLLPDGRVGIGTSTPDSSAILDISDTARGLLLPAFTSGGRLSIAFPPRGLTVYDSSKKAFYYYHTGWKVMGGDNLGNHTATQTINTNGKKLSNNGSSSGLLLDSSGNAGLSGRLSATGATLTGTGGTAQDYHILSNAGGDVGTRKAFGAVGISYIIALYGYYPQSGGTPMYNVTFIGEIHPFAPVGAATVPAGWALCDGQLLSIPNNIALFSLIGNSYGGDGISTFALPDLRGATPVGAGASPAGYNWNTGDKTN